jgi:hypothetical protein
MTNFCCASTKRAPVRFRAILVVAAFALAGCNANQGVNSSSPTVADGPDFPGYNAYDPTKYAQTSGFYAGGGGR